MYKHTLTRPVHALLTRAACLALTGALALACVGCGGETGDKEAGGSPTTTAAVTTTTAPAAATTGEAVTTTEKNAATTITPVADTTAPAAPTTAQQPQTPAPLTEAQQNAIRQAYRDNVRARYPDDENVQKLTLDDVGLRHIATYGDCIVLFIDVPCFAHPDMLDVVTFEGQTFHFTSYQRPVAYRAGTFKTFQKAFESGWLTRDDLADLALHFPET